MKLIRKIPLEFKGDLTDIYLVNFSVLPEELEARFGPLPHPIQPKLFGGRAMISMVDVHLRNMRLSKGWLPFRFHYHHIAFRLLIQDQNWKGDAPCQGIYFLRSFTDRPLIAAGGQLLTHYQFQTAHIEDHPGGLRFSTDQGHLSYNVAGPVAPEAESKTLKALIGSIDRAYAAYEGQVWETKIMREQWPLKAMHCNQFETNFFASARLEGVFKVTEPISYTWLPARPVGQIEQTAQAAPQNVSLAWK